MAYKAQGLMGGAAYVPDNGLGKQKQKRHSRKEQAQQDLHDAKEHQPATAAGKIRGSDRNATHSRLQAGGNPPAFFPYFSMAF
jgi:hypothetical protein